MPSRMVALPPSDSIRSSQGVKPAHSQARSVEGGRLDNIASPVIGGDGDGVIVARLTFRALLQMSAAVDAKHLDRLNINGMKLARYLLDSFHPEAG